MAERFKNKKCKVLSYDKDFNELSILFDEYGIVVPNATKYNGEDKEVTVKYRGDIEGTNFEVKL